MTRGGYPQPWGSEAQYESATDARARRQRALPLAIPDDPNYQRHVPIEYRLDAKQIVGELAVDLQSGKGTSFWVELAHAGLVAADILEAPALTIAAGAILAAAAPLIAIGAAYQDAAEIVAKQYASAGFSRGAVMGADGRPPSLVRDYFGNTQFDYDPKLPNGREIRKANHGLGLIAGFGQGRMLSKNQRAIFWHDLGYRMGDQSYRGPMNTWARLQWVQWYIDAATAFSMHHLV
jgi:hypothetical protein